MTICITSRKFAALLLGLGVFVLSFVRLDGAEPTQRASGAKLPAPGSIDGFVAFRGTIPKSSIADDAGMQRDLLQVDRASRGLANVVVWLTEEGSRVTN